jgi:MazG family protein
MNTTENSFLRLINIMNDLREKCPWDKKQTIETLRQLTIEETYELADAITDKDWKGIKEELGDLLLHIVFYAKIGGEKNEFTLTEVIDGVCEKLIHRHPHIYGDVKVVDEEDVKRNWEKLKMKEGKDSVLSGVPKSLPSMVKAMRLQEKAKQVGFEWDEKEQVWEKVEEEMKELQEAVGSWQEAVGSGQEAVSSGQWAKGSGQLEGGSGQEAGSSGQLAVGRGQEAVGSGQEAVGSGQEAGSSGQLAVGREQEEVTKNAGGEDISTLAANVEDELGDVFFSLVNYARFLQVDAENALERTNKKFISRFTKMESAAMKDGKNLQDMTLEEMDSIWNKIKQSPD